jgi:hypothetical protein
MAKKQLKDYKFVPAVVPPAFGQFPNAVSAITANREYIVEEILGYIASKYGTPSFGLVAGNKTTYAQVLLAANKEFIKEEANAWVVSQIANAQSPFVGYNYTITKQAKCKRDIGYLIDAFLLDLAGGGNFETIRIARMFYLNGEAQLIDPVQEAAVHTFVKDLIASYVFTNTAYATTQGFAAQVINANDGEADAIAASNILNGIVIDVINSGLPSLPAIVYNYNVTWAEYRYGATKCKRDIAYILEGVGYDIALQTNYFAVFLGHAEANSKNYTADVTTRINAAKTEVLALSAVSSSAPAIAQVNSDFTEIVTSAAAGINYVGSAVTFTDPSSATSSQIAAKNRLVANREFIQAEINAYVGAFYPEHNHSEAKCARDVGYAVDALCFDILYGGNTAVYDSAMFFNYAGGVVGITDEHLAQTIAAYDRLKVIVSEIVLGTTVAKTTTGTTPNTFAQDASGVSADAGDAVILAAAVQVIADVVENGNASLPATRIAPAVAWSTTALKAAQTAITSASVTIQNTVVDYVDYVYNQTRIDKCRRDSYYVIDSYIYDMVQGGNSLSYYVASQYQINNIQQVVNGDIEVETQTFARNLINNYILTNIYHPSYNFVNEYQTLQLGVTAEATADNKILELSNIIINCIDTGLSALPAPVAPDNRNGTLMSGSVGLLESNKRFIQEEAIAYIQFNIDNNIIPFVFFTYNTEKCRRDISYVLEGYISDLKNGGNQQTTFNASKYFEGGVAQVDGDRLPEVFTHVFIRDLIENFIWTNIPYTPKQILASQVFDSNAVIEIFANTRMKELSNTIINVIQFGLDYLPATVSNRGYVKIPGYYKSKDFLLITNTNRNEIMYSFADPLLSAEVTYKEDFDSDFAGALFGVDKITTLTFSVDTSHMMVTDNIQIFVESKYQEVRLNQSGTDAMERMRVGIPQSMLDADFEYGLQPTKWQALALLRNYPSIYEIPGSDQSVVSVITDASAGTGGSGASLITVTTVSSHGLVAGDAFTIKALANTINGFSRAEGSFLVSTAPQPNQLTYFAKSKVGTSNGQVLATSYTQLRKGAFYTNASVGAPAFSVFSSGSSGTITTSLITPLGATTVGFTGEPPPIGSPLSGTGVNSGTQVTAVTGSGGAAATTKLATPASIDDTSLTVVSTTGISQGLIINRGDGEAVIVTGVSGQIVSLSGPVTTAVLGTAQSYAGKTQDVSSTTTGSGGVFTVSRSGSTYTTTVTNPGSSYTTSDTVIILGTELGGATTANDATITITASPRNFINAFGGISTGTGGWTPDADTPGVATTGVTGSAATVDIVVDGVGVIQAVTVSSGGFNYQINDIISITQAGTDNDATVRVAAIDLNGTIVTFDTITQTPNAGAPYTTATGLNTVTTTTTFGTGAVVTVTAGPGGDATALLIENSGSGYQLYDRIQLTGGNGDTTVQVNDVGAGGLITGVSTTGTPITAPDVNFVSAFTISEPTTAQLANGNTALSFSSIATIQITFAGNHGFVPGSTITVQITSAGAGAQFAAGAYFVEQVPASNIIRYTARAPGNIDNTLVGNIYARPDSFFVHRPFDGGVQLGTASPAHGATAIRMSKKYIRYQSGKGVQYNTGALFAPSYDLRSITAASTAIGAVITVTTDDTDHGCQIGGVITINGVESFGYDGEYTVINIINERVLQVLAQKRLASTTGSIGSPCYMSIRKWHGATVRSGIFDDQNGMFWQYDGQRMAVVRRSSTFQIAGTIDITPNQNLVTGSNTRFTQQLAQGDRIVIRGMTHIVSKIDSDTSLTVTPDYRGVVQVSGAKVAKTVDTIVPQEWWNLDTLNGAGASGYNLDVTKMQMIGIQHTWYGAGFIDFMLRGSDGNYLWAHRFRNSNVNTEAYMRTGNQPVRYEVINEGAKGRLSAAVNATQTTLPIYSEDIYYFPNSGTVYVDNEVIRYTGRTATALTGCVRATPLSQFVAGSSRNFTAGTATVHALNAGVALISNTITPNISHWGSAFMIDGQFDSDRGYIFNYAATAISASVDKTTAFLIRLAPSVSNAIIGDLGEKELLNRAQLLLSAISVTSDTVSGGGAIVIEGVLNPSNYPTDPTRITWTGLSSSAAGGQPSFAQIAAGGSVSWSGNLTTTTATVQGALTTTLTAKSFNLITATITATAFTAINQTVTVRSFSSASNPTYTQAFSNLRNTFLITQSDLNTLNTNTTVQNGDVLAVVGNGQVIANVNASASSISSFISKTGTGPFIVTFNVPTLPYTPVAGQTVTVAGANGGTYNGIQTIQAGSTTTSIILSYASDPGTYINGGTITFGIFTCNNPGIALVLGERIRLTGTLVGSTGTIAGYVNGTDYFIVNTNGSTQFQLSTTLQGLPVRTATSGAMTSNAVFTLGTFVSSNQTITAITPNFITIGSVAHALITMSGNANLPSQVANSDGQFDVSLRITSSLATTYGTAVSNARTDFLIPQTQFASTTIAVADVLSATTFITGGQTVASTTANYVRLNNTAYARIVMTGAGTASSVAGSPVTVTVTNSVSNTYNRALNSSRLDFLVTNADFDASNIQLSDITSATTFLLGGQIISNFTRSYLNISGTDYTRIVLSATPGASSTPNSGNDVAVTITAAGTAASYNRTNFLYFTASSWLASGAVLGTRIATSYTQFPAGTAITTILTRTLGATTVYRVVFTQTSNTTLNAGATPLFQFGALYALPGEQVFSFIANPGESGELSLEALKELTATAIGGRGTFPNGPDVLAINVYKVSGTATPTNIILRWGEAQA